MSLSRFVANEDLTITLSLLPSSGNECDLDMHDCSVNAACEDTPTSFICTCLSGYAGDGRTCVDIDECVSGKDDCSPDSTCNNTDGGYNCVCADGYSYTGDGVLKCEGTGGREGNVCPCLPSKT